MTQIHPHNFRSVRCVIDLDMTHRFYKNSGPVWRLILGTELFSGFLRFSVAMSELNIMILGKTRNDHGMNKKQEKTCILIITKFCKLHPILLFFHTLLMSTYYHKIKLLPILDPNLTQVCHLPSFLPKPNDKCPFHFLPLASLGIIVDFRRR